MEVIKNIVFWVLVFLFIFGGPFAAWKYGPMDDESIRRANETCKEYGMKAVPHVRPADGRIVSVRCREQLK